MIKKYLPALVSILFYIAAILGINLLAIFIYGAIQGVLNSTDIFQASSFFSTLANALFWEGGIILTFGAFLEFFVKARSPSIGRSMMLPHEVFSRMGALEAKDRDAARMEEEHSGGLMSIFLGALIIIISAMFAIISLK